MKLEQEEGRPAFHQPLLLYYLNFCHEYALLFSKKKKKIKEVKERRREGKTRQLLGTGTKT